MLQIIYEERGLTLRDMTFSHARDMIEMLKQKERPEYYEDMLTLPLDTLKEKNTGRPRTQKIVSSTVISIRKRSALRWIITT